MRDVQVLHSPPGVIFTPPAWGLNQWLSGEPACTSISVHCPEAQLISPSTCMQGGQGMVFCYWTKVSSVASVALESKKNYVTAQNVDSDTQLLYYPLENCICDNTAKVWASIQLTKRKTRFVLKCQRFHRSTHKIISFEKVCISPRSIDCAIAALAWKKNHW